MHKQNEKELDSQEFWNVTDVYWQQVIFDLDGFKFKDVKHAVIAQTFFELGARMVFSDILARLAVYGLAKTGENAEKNLHFTIDDAKERMRHFAETLNAIHTIWDSEIQVIHDYFSRHTDFSKGFMDKLILDLEKAADNAKKVAETADKKK